MDTKLSGRSVPSSFTVDPHCHIQHSIVSRLPSQYTKFRLTFRKQYRSSLDYFCRPCALYKDSRWKFLGFSGLQQAQATSLMIVSKRVSCARFHAMPRTATSCALRRLPAGFAESCTKIAQVVNGCTAPLYECSSFVNMKFQTGPTLAKQFSLQRLMQSS